jgi:hypothetical protein
MVDLNGHEAGNGGYSQRKPTAHRVSSTRKLALWPDFNSRPENFATASNLEGVGVGYFTTIDEEGHSCVTCPLAHAGRPSSVICVVTPSWELGSGPSR